MAQVDVKDLVKEFCTPTGPLRILNGISLELSDGQNLAVVGPSGSGKSTLLHIIGTLDTATSGTCHVLGTDALSLEENQLAQFRNENIGFIFQEHHLLPQLSALENVLIPALAAGSSDQTAVEHASRLLERVGLGDRFDHRPGTLSGGERQRVAVARALMNQPKLLLADEPTGSLDQVNARAIGKMLLELQAQEQIMLVCVTHSDELASGFDRQVRLDSGKLREVA